MIDLLQCWTEKVTETCTVQMYIGIELIILLCIYRYPFGNFGEFVVIEKQVF